MQHRGHARASRTIVQNPVPKAIIYHQYRTHTDTSPMVFPVFGTKVEAEGNTDP